MPHILPAGTTTAGLRAYVCSAEPLEVTEPLYTRRQPTGSWSPLLGLGILAVSVQSPSITQISKILAEELCPVVTLVMVTEDLGRASTLNIMPPLLQPEALTLTRVARVCGGPTTLDDEALRTRLALPLRALAEVTPLVAAALDAAAAGGAMAAALEPGQPPGRLAPQPSHMPHALQPDLPPPHPHALPRSPFRSREPQLQHFCP